MTEMTEPRTRRALLTAGIAAAAAAAAASVSQVAPALGANGSNVKVGQNQKGTKTTTVTNDANKKPALQGRSETGTGLQGNSKSGTGVVAVSEGGVGLSATSTGGDAIQGGSNGGAGVSGTSFAGTGVVASSMNGFALETTSGPVRFKGLSGVATIPTGDKHTTVQPDAGVSGKTFVLLTPEENIDSRALWFERGSNGSEFSIHISSSRDKETKISWFAIEHG